MEEFALVAPGHERVECYRLFRPDRPNAATKHSKIEQRRKSVKIETKRDRRRLLTRERNVQKRTEGNTRKYFVRLWAKTVQLGESVQSGKNGKFPA